ncbi:MAG: GerMN domain-containing protein [bacterium]|nr:GerMN domain-containing protein [bacterium]
MAKKSGGFNFIFFGLIIILMIGAGIYFLKYLPKRSKNAAKPVYSETAPKIKESDEKMKISLYFSSPDDEHLVVESREIYRTSSRIDQVKQAVIALIEGSNKDLDPIIPEGTVLKEVFLDKNGTAYVDFSIELIKNHPGGSSGEIMTVYGIVNTLCANFSEIKNVQILVEGKEIETISGHLDTRYPFSMKNI